MFLVPASRGFPLGTPPRKPKLPNSNSTTFEWLQGLHLALWWSVGKLITLYAVN